MSRIQNIQTEDELTVPEAHVSFGSSGSGTFKVKYEKDNKKFKNL